jgi:predicted ribosomally synthesized peptide with nif11-like leader
MSIESAKAFAERMTTDDAFRTQLQEASSDEERQVLIQVAGYKFTQEEWETIRSELNEQQLEAVAGGVQDFNFQPPSRVFPGLENSAGPFGGTYQPSRVQDY